MTSLEEKKKAGKWVNVDMQESEQLETQRLMHVLPSSSLKMELGNVVRTRLDIYNPKIIWGGVSKSGSHCALKVPCMPISRALFFKS